ncbi:MAG TPA: hypothetical protein PLN61_12675 [bacterium]|nr:hypothetical protein [bacterium]HQI49502.1 hypothetical protein [bacterium]HQJ63882.1 hypothetical protein [bacterium]
MMGRKKPLRTTMSGGEASAAEGGALVARQQQNRIFTRVAVKGRLRLSLEVKAIYMFKIRNNSKNFEDEADNM